jgi:hypothetical protein
MGRFPFLDNDSERDRDFPLFDGIQAVLLEAAGGGTGSPRSLSPCFSAGFLRKPDPASPDRVTQIYRKTKHSLRRA